MKRFFYFFIFGMLLSFTTMVTSCGLLPEGLLGDDEEGSGGNGEAKLSINDLYLPGEGAEYVVTLKNAGSLKYVNAEIRSENGGFEGLKNWCHAEVTKEGILIKVDPNEDSYFRTENIAVESISPKSGEISYIGTIVVHQSVYVERIAMDSEAPLFTKQGGVQEISVVSEGRFLCDIDQKNSWCTVLPVSGKAGKAFQVTTTPNPGTTMREASIRVYDSTTKGAGGDSWLVIRQAGDEPVLELSKSILGFSLLGGVKDFYVASSSPNWTVEQPEADKEWYSYQIEGGRVKITIKNGAGLLGRQGKLLIKAGELTKEVTIVQYGGGPIFVVSSTIQTSLRFAASGGGKPLDVVSNAEYESSSSESWCSISDGYVVVEPNKSAEPREATITLVAKTGTGSIKVAVWQAGSNPIVGTWEFAFYNQLVFCPEASGHDYGYNLSWTFNEDGTCSTVSEIKKKIRGKYVYNRGTKVISVSDFVYSDTNEPVGGVNEASVVLKYIDEGTGALVFTSYDDECICVCEVTYLRIE